MSPRSQLIREGLGLKLRQCVWGLHFTFYITMLSMQCTLLLLPPAGWRLDQKDPRKTPTGPRLPGVGQEDRPGARLSNRVACGNWGRCQG